MRVLVACEFSGAVRDAFRAAGHDAWSCDLLATMSDAGGPHIQGDALEVARWGWDLMVPIGILSTKWQKPDQIVQPWMFGHGETKATCLWLRGLPPLMVTDQVTGRVPRVHLEPPGPDRWMRRSVTYQGLARAMAEQWGSIHEAAA